MHDLHVPLKSLLCRPYLCRDGVSEHWACPGSILLDEVIHCGIHARKSQKHVAWGRKHTITQNIEFHLNSKIHQNNLEGRTWYPLDHWSSEGHWPLTGGARRSGTWGTKPDCGWDPPMGHLSSEGQTTEHGQKPGKKHHAPAVQLDVHVVVFRIV